MNKILNRREAVKLLGLGAVGVVTGSSLMCQQEKTHIITLSYDDGFEKSSIKTAEIYEKYGLSACINVIASRHLDQSKLPDEYHAWPVGDFELWNELKSRGHEIMPHSYKHANLNEVPFEEAKDLIRKCMDVFNDELEGFVEEESIYNFAYNASNPEIEEWLSAQVRAFRTGGGAINPFPYEGMKKLTCTSYGPDNIDKHLEETISKFLEGPSGWLIYNTHGLDDEGWGPVSSWFLDELLERLTEMKHVAVLPVAPALDLA
ncbi:MAG: polysaccharide deacetylase family protein [Bacteroidales bacterium]|nr:polysaccharide deacetylase family protein [Bacteroidales bacterium]